MQISPLPRLTHRPIIALSARRSWRKGFGGRLCIRPLLNAMSEPCDYRPAFICPYTLNSEENMLENVPCIIAVAALLTPYAIMRPAKHQAC